MCIESSSDVVREKVIEIHNAGRCSLLDVLDVVLDLEVDNDLSTCARGAEILLVLLVHFMLDLCSATVMDCQKQDSADKDEARMLSDERS